MDDDHPMFTGTANKYQPCPANHQAFFGMGRPQRIRQDGAMRAMNFRITPLYIRGRLRLNNGSQMNILPLQDCATSKALRGGWS
jgi:hypothetical protein